MGYHQIDNALIAIQALEVLNKRWRHLKREKIIEAVENVQWPGRLEIVKDSPTIILDGAHNEEGIKAIRAFIQEFFSSPLILIFAIMKDKEIAKIAKILFPRAKKIILTQFPYYRAATPEEILKKALSFQDNILLESDPHQALLKAYEIVKPKEIILITGSLFLVGEIKKYLSN